MKRILVLGGTGAMGTYLVPELLSMGYKVDVVSIDDVISTNQNLKYIKADAKNAKFLTELLKNEYSAIVDFLVHNRPSGDFKNTLMPLFLENTDHYINLSTYRVYSGVELPIKETSPRLLDVITDNQAYLDAKEDEYSLYKAIGENMLLESGYKNWTVVRPAITYSKFRFQLVTLEANVLIERMRENKTVLLPKEAMGISATMSWAGDVAKMIARLVLNKNSYGEIYTVSTAENHLWQEIAEFYKEIGGLKYETVDKDTYLELYAQNANWARWQLEYDRLLNRVIDNSKILNITGMKQSELMPLKKGLKLEYDRLPKDFVWCGNDANERMDAYLAGK